MRRRTTSHACECMVCRCDYGDGVVLMVKVPQQTLRGLVRAGRPTGATNPRMRPYSATRALMMTRMMASGRSSEAHGEIAA